MMCKKFCFLSLLSCFLFALFVSPPAFAKKVTSGVMASESARGTVARSMARDLSQGSAQKEAELYKTFMVMRERVEGLMDQLGFVRGDIGTAYGIYFITLWELANEVELSEEKEIQAVKYWTTHFKELGMGSDALGKSKDQFYDLLLHTPVIMVALKELGEQTGNREMRSVIPDQAAELFIFITKYPASVVSINADGSMKMNKAKLEKFLKTGDEKQVARFLKSTMSDDQVAEFLSKRGKVSSVAKSKDRSSAVADTYTSIINTNTLMMFPNSWP